MTNCLPTPYSDGYDAFLAGWGEDANPYDLATDNAASWNDGWIAARDEAEGEE